jgi:hypothetical protein
METTYMKGIQLITSSKINVTLYANGQVLLAHAEKELQITVHHIKTIWNSLLRKINSVTDSLIDRYSVYS